MNHREFLVAGATLGSALLYTAGDMPEIDALLISHDHYTRRIALSLAALLLSFLPHAFCFFIDVSAVNSL